MQFKDTTSYNRKEPILLEEIQNNKLHSHSLEKGRHAETAQTCVNCNGPIIAEVHPTPAMQYIYSRFGVVLNCSIQQC